MMPRFSASPDPDPRTLKNPDVSLASPRIFRDFFQKTFCLVNPSISLSPPFLEMDRAILEIETELRWLNGEYPWGVPKDVEVPPYKVVAKEALNLIQNNHPRTTWFSRE